MPGAAITYSNEALERLAARKPEPAPAFVCVLVEGLVETQGRGAPCRAKLKKRGAYSILRGRRVEARDPWPVALHRALRHVRPQHEPANP